MIAPKYIDWIAFKKESGMTNKKAAEIIGTSVQNIKQQISPNKPLPSWARAFIWSWRESLL